MATTPGGVPYPAPTDTADVARDIKALAEWVDQHLPTGAGLTPDPDLPGFFTTT